MGKETLGMSNYIHPTSTVDYDVKLGDNNYIGPYCYLTGNLTIGDNNRFEGYCSVGTRPEHKDYWEENGSTQIGSNNVFREFVTINAGTENITEVHDNIIMLRGSHVAHDCIIENGVTLSVNAIMLGHVHVMKESNCGTGCLVHQYQVIGSWSMIGMGCVIPKKSDIKPGGVWVGNPAKWLRENTHKTNNITKGEYNHEIVRWRDILGHHLPTKKV